MKKTHSNFASFIKHLTTISNAIVTKYSLHCKARSNLYECIGNCFVVVPPPNDAELWHNTQCRQKKSQTLKSRISLIHYNMFQLFRSIILFHLSLHLFDFFFPLRDASVQFFDQSMEVFLEFFVFFIFIPQTIYRFLKLC